MKFCPTCEIRLKRDGSALKCPQCGHVQGGAKPDSAPVPDASEFNVLDADEGTQALPTINKECPKCGHGQAVWWMLQTRSADEATTQFYRCVKCNHTWRNYD